MEDPIVTVKQGQLKGVTCRSVLGPTYLAFRGIPFAAPPVGELRFKDPKPPIPWSGIRDASENGPICAQHVSYFDIGFSGSDDCLYLNVYTRSLTERKPIMVWIHGGSFISGSGNDSVKRPDYLITQDVVLVSINYRLGVFGFLNLKDKAAPGNQAVKDIIAGLEWMKENIAHFGGDPDNITIFGDSAGGVLVNCLVISPALKGRRLFHKAISQGGTLKSVWAQRAGYPEYSFRLAAAVGIKSKNPEEIVKCLQKLPCEQLVKAQFSLLTITERAFFRLAFGCVVDDVAEEPVLPLPFDQLMTNDADIPFIVGWASHEFLMFLPTTHEMFLSKLEESLPIYIENLLGVDSKTAQQLARTLKSRFLNGKPASKHNIRGFVELFSELFIDGNREFVESRRDRECAPTYVYRFSYAGFEKCTTDLLVKRAIHAASHVDESCYLFYPTQCKHENPDPPAEGTKDRLTIERMVRLWANFAKTGNPTPTLDEFITVTWEPVSSENNYCLDIGNELKMTPCEPCLRSLIK